MTTRGTLYALFPSRFALGVLARLGLRMQQAAPRPISSVAKMQAGFVRRALAAKMPTEEPSASRVAKSRIAGVGLSESTPQTNAEVSIDYDSAPADRFCDVVMEGGVTSGIIYASAVVELAKSYRFHSIGGSSIGAFAAALTAAAEYRRRKGSVQGFQLMANAPTEIAAEDEQGRTRLQRMFKPQQSTSRLYGNPFVDAGT